MTAIIFGDSHGAMMARQFGAFSEQWEEMIEGVISILDPDRSVVGYLIITYDIGNFFKAIELDGQHYLTTETRFQAPLEALNIKGNTSFLLVGGNEHSQFIQTHPVPFDFYHPDCPDRWVAGRQVIGSNVIQQILSRALERVRVRLTIIRNLMSKTNLQVVAPPPPIPSTEHLHLHSECFNFALRPLEDRWVRLKVYKLYIEEVRSMCVALGLGFIEPPAQCVDADGFLLEPYWHQATHAEPAYYQPIREAWENAK